MLTIWIVSTKLVQFKRTSNWEWGKKSCDLDQSIVLELKRHQQVDVPDFQLKITDLFCCTTHSIPDARLPICGTITKQNCCSTGKEGEEKG